MQNANTPSAAPVDPFQLAIDALTEQPAIIAPTGKAMAERSYLMSALKIVKRAVSTRQDEQRECILIETADDRLIFTATNGHDTTRAALPASVCEPFRALVSASHFSAWISTTKDAPVSLEFSPTAHFETKDDSGKITFRRLDSAALILRASYSRLTMPSPEIGEAWTAAEAPQNSRRVDVDGDDFARALATVLPFYDRKDTTPFACNCVQITHDPAAQILRFVTCDGHRHQAHEILVPVAGYSSAPSHGHANGQDAKTVLILGKSAENWARTLGKGERVSLILGDDAAALQTYDATHQTRTVDAKELPAALEFVTAYTVETDRKNLARLVSMLQKTQRGDIEFKAESGQLFAGSYDNSENGDMEEILPAQVSADFAPVCLNAKFVRDALKPNSKSAAPAVLEFGIVTPENGKPQAAARIDGVLIMPRAESSATRRAAREIAKADAPTESEAREVETDAPETFAGFNRAVSFQATRAQISAAAAKLTRAGFKSAIQEKRGARGNREFTLWTEDHFEGFSTIGREGIARRKAQAARAASVATVEEAPSPASDATPNQANAPRLQWFCSDMSDDSKRHHLYSDGAKTLYFIVQAANQCHRAQQQGDKYGLFGAGMSEEFGFGKRCAAILGSFNRLSDAKRNAEERATSSAPRFEAQDDAETEATEEPSAQQPEAMPGDAVAQFIERGGYRIGNGPFTGHELHPAQLESLAPAIRAELSRLILNEATSSQPRAYLPHLSAEEKAKFQKRDRARLTRLWPCVFSFLHEIGRGESLPDPGPAKETRGERFKCNQQAPDVSPENAVPAPLFDAAELPEPSVPEKAARTKSPAAIIAAKLKAHARANGLDLESLATLDAPAILVAIAEATAANAESEAPEPDAPEQPAPDDEPTTEPEPITPRRRERQPYRREPFRRRRHAPERHEPTRRQPATAPRSLCTVDGKPIRRASYADFAPSGTIPSKRFLDLYQQRPRHIVQIGRTIAAHAQSLGLDTKSLSQHTAKNVLRAIEEATPPAVETASAIEIHKMTRDEFAALSTRQVYALVNQLMIHLWSGSQFHDEAKTPEGRAAIHRVALRNRFNNEPSALSLRVLGSHALETPTHNAHCWFSREIAKRIEAEAPAPAVEAPAPTHPRGDVLPRIAARAAAVAAYTSNIRAF